MCGRFKPTLADATSLGFTANYPSQAIENDGASTRLPGSISLDLSGIIACLLLVQITSKRACLSRIDLATNADVGVRRLVAQWVCLLADALLSHTDWSRRIGCEAILHDLPRHRSTGQQPRT